MTGKHVPVLGEDWLGCLRGLTAWLYGSAGQFLREYVVIKDSGGFQYTSFSIFILGS